MSQVNEVMRYLLLLTPTLSKMYDKIRSQTLKHSQTVYACIHICHMHILLLVFFIVRKMNASNQDIYRQILEFLKLRSFFLIWVFQILIPNSLYSIELTVSHLYNRNRKLLKEDTGPMEYSIKQQSGISLRSNGFLVLSI